MKCKTETKQDRNKRAASALKTILITGALILGLGNQSVYANAGTLEIAGELEFFGPIIIET